MAETIKFRVLKPEEIAVRIYDTREREGVVTSVRLGLGVKSRETCSIRLDEAVGAERWQNEFTPQGDYPICSISIYFPERGWVKKSDCGENPMGEASLKPAFSDAFKRCAYKWGIGRELFFLPDIEVRADMLTSPIVDGNGRVTGYYDSLIVESFECDENSKPTLLTIKNRNNGQIIYKYDNRVKPIMDFSTGNTTAVTPAPVVTTPAPAPVAPVEATKKTNEKVGTKPTRVKKETPAPTTPVASTPVVEQKPVVKEAVVEKEEIPFNSPDANTLMQQIVAEAEAVKETAPERKTAVVEIDADSLTYDSSKDVVSDCGTSHGTKLGIVESKAPSNLVWVWQNTQNETVKKAIEVIAHNNNRVFGFFVEKGIAI